MPNESYLQQYPKLAKDKEYQECIKWFATPSDERDPKTIEELTVKLDVDLDEMTSWTSREDFYYLINRLHRLNLVLGTADVIKALLKNITATGNASGVKLWLDLIKNMTDPDNIRGHNLADLLEESGIMKKGEAIGPLPENDELYSNKKRLP